MKNIVLKKNNKGSTLLMVVIAIAFVAILGSLTISLTMTNIQMKAIDSQSKENFYMADSVLTEIKASIEEIGTIALENAYRSVLHNYAEISNDPNKSLMDELDRRFLDNVMIALTTSGNVSGTAYDVDKIKLHMRNEYKTGDVGILNVNGDPVMYPNTIVKKFDETNPDAERCITLKGVHIKYHNKNNDQETIITTDIILQAPKLEFSASSKYPEFSKYTIIADKKFSTGAANSNFTILGNLYAGAEGVSSSYGTLNINGESLITRGNVAVGNGATLNIGSPTEWMNIWSENITTDKLTGSSLAAEMNINGNCNVSNDLILNAKNSKVSIRGNYYGYNFNKKNVPITDNTVLENNLDSEYSSAILINGAASSLDLTGLNKLQVVGRAFVSRENEASGSSERDIFLGQSLATKGNQTAYLVQSTYLKVGHNPIARSEFTGPSFVDEINTAEIPDAIKNLLSDDKVTVYCYTFNGIELIYYYWDFKNQQAANTYFLDYYSIEENKADMDNQAKQYVAGGGIRLAANLYLLGSNILSIDPTTGSSTLLGTASVNPDIPNADILKDSLRRAMEYKARQLTLLSSAQGVTPEEPRLLNKNDSPLFESLITQKDGQAEIANEARNVDKALYGFDNTKRKALELDLNGDLLFDCTLVFVDNSESGDGAFSISTVNPINSDRTGIVVATGDVLLDSNFKGLIISGGKVETQGDFTISSNVDLVLDILNYGLDHYGTEKEKNFIHYFAQYNNGGNRSSGNLGTVDIASGILFENWKKNAD